jgi:hypothetical protein
MEGAVGAYLNTTITPYATVIVEIDLFIAAGDCLCRAILPAFTT